LSYSAERTRRRSKRRRYAIGRTVGALSLLGLIAVIAWSVFLRHSEPSSTQIAPRSGWTFANAGLNLATGTQPTLSSQAFGQSERAVYRYSVVPGGVRTVDELRQASDHDPIVAAHYTGFDFRKARVVQVKQPKLVYLSYRIGDQLLWTKRRLSLHVGETLITDGRTTARGRCGNQVSGVLHMRTSPAEPSVEALDQLIAIPAARPIPLESALVPSGFATADLPPGIGTRGLSPGGGLPPGLIVAPPGGGGGGGCVPKLGFPCHSSPMPPVTPPPVNMAEPSEPSLLGSMMLFWAGIAGVYFHRRKMRLKIRDSILRLRSPHSLL
jgi:hypothetical protein